MGRGEEGGREALSQNSGKTQSVCERERRKLREQTSHLGSKTEWRWGGGGKTFCDDVRSDNALKTTPCETAEEPFLHSGAVVQIVFLLIQINGEIMALVCGAYQDNQGLQHFNDTYRRLNPAIYQYKLVF